MIGDWLTRGQTHVGWLADPKPEMEGSLKKWTNYWNGGVS